MNLNYSFALLRNVCLAFLSLCVTTVAIAQTVFTGSQDANYLTAANWSNGLPAPGNDAVIPGGAVVFVNGNLDADYDMNSFGEITLGGTLAIRGEWSLSGALITKDNRVNVVDTLLNFGSITVSNGGSIFVTPDAFFRTTGPIAADGWIGVRGKMLNGNTIEVKAKNNLAIYSGGEFENRGIVNVFGALINRDSGVYFAPNGGTINVKDSGIVNNLRSAVMTNAGVIRVDEGGRFLQQATLVNVPGRIFVSGNFTTYDGSTTTSSFFTVEKPGVLNIDGGDEFEVAFSLQNFGLTRVNRPVIVRGLVNNGPDARFTIASLGVLDFVVGTNLNNEGTFTNGGLIKTVGTLTNDGSFVNNDRIIQDGNGTIANNKAFVNAGLIESVDRIVNNSSFRNDGRLTNKSGGVIENNDRFENAAGAHIQNLFNIINKRNLVNNGFFENGVSLFNESLFVNNAFLDNVGDIVNSVSGTINNNATGVLNNSGAGIFTNNGIVNNRGELNNFACGIFVNNNLINNFQWISNEGILFNNGTITGKPIMGNGPVTVQDGTSDKICKSIEVSLSQEGKTRVDARLLAAERFDSCTALEYLVDEKAFVEYTCANLGKNEVIFTLRDRRGNTVNCKATITVVDEAAPKVSGCPADIALLNVAKAPLAVNFAAPKFTDNCGPVTVTSNKKPGDLFPEGRTVVTYTARDPSGNTFVCAFNVVVTVKPTPPPPADGCEPQNPHGLIAYYNLTPEDDKYVFDRAGFGDPLHLEIKDTKTIQYEKDCGLVNTGHSIVKSFGSAENIGNSLQMSNAITVETWVRADKLQSGPERVVTYSENTGARNFTLGQEGNRWVFRLKTTHTDGNGMPDRLTASGSVKVGTVQHVVFTRSADGKENFYVDGQLSYSGTRGGDFSNWGTHCHLALFNEMTLDRSFLGAIKKVAIYDRALSASEVAASLKKGACCEGDDSPLGQVCQGPRGQVTHERFNGIGGVDLPWLYKATKYPKSPDHTQKLTKLEIPSHVGDNYGTRTRGWIYPTKTGAYQLAVSGDDHTRLLFSRAADRAGYVYTVAAVYGWTNPGDLHKYDTQKSESFQLEAGKGYYFELHQKEGTGGDHASVYWKVPGSSKFELIGTGNIGDIKACEKPVTPKPDDCVTQKGSLLREVWTGINSNDIWALLKDPRYPHKPTRSDYITKFASEVNTADQYGTRVRGYIHPDVTGDYVFTVTGDDQTKLMLSTDATDGNSVAIAEVNGWTGVTEFNKYASQVSKKVRLVKGQRYYVELLHQEGGGGDHFNVYWQTPTNHTRHVIPGANLSPYKDCDAPKPAACNKDILFVVGNSSLNNGDAAVKHYLVSLGYNVLVKDSKWATLDMAQGKGLIVISSTVNSSDIGDRFTNTAIPLLTWESYLYDDLKMTMGTAGTDYGSDHTKTTVVDGSVGKLAAGLNGHQQLTNSNSNFGWGKVMGSDAKSIAYQAGDKWRVNIFVYDAGDRMAGGAKAPATRIGYYLDDNAAAMSTAEGAKLFKVLIEYATNCEGNVQGLRINPDILRLEATRKDQQVSLKWTNNTAFKNEYFTVERSSNGGRFEVIATVEAAGEGDAVQTFDYVDAAPAKGDNVYRVTAMYNDNSDYSSEQRLVRFVQEGRVNVYPNPATEHFTVSLSEFGDRDVTLVVTDPLGRQVARRNVPAGQRQVEFDTQDYASGAYSITIVTGGFLSTEMVVVTRD